MLQALLGAKDKWDCKFHNTVRELISNVNMIMIIIIASINR